MTRNNEATPDGGRLSRRTVLRGVGTAAGLAGLGLAATPAEATQRCPRPRQYWMDAEFHPHVRRHIEDPYELGGVRRSLAAWRLFLREEFSEDKAAMMAQQVLTAKFNNLMRPDPDPDCVNAALEAYGGREVERTRHDAVAWLRYSAFGQGTQECWTVETGDGVVDGYPMYELLARYNHADLDELDCDCYEGAGGDHDLPPLGPESFGPCRDAQSDRVGGPDIGPGESFGRTVYVGDGTPSPR